MGELKFFMYLWMLVTSIIVTIVFIYLVILYTNKKGLNIAMRGKEVKGYISYLLSTYHKEMIGKSVFVSMVATIFIGGILMSYLRPEPYSTYEHHLYIYSLYNDDISSGDFILGTDTHNDIEYYRYYYRTTEGYSKDKIPVNDVYIKETDSRDPEIVRIYDSYEPTYGINWERVSTYYYVMYVPKNTIIRNFKIK